MPVDLKALRDRYLAAQLAGDRDAALRVLLEEGLEAGAAVGDLVLHVIQPAQHEIGRLWQSNTINVAQEHLATAISQVALSRLYAHLPRESKVGKRVVVACVEGERHELGARVAADFMETAGYDVRFLGADVPTDSLLRLLGEHRPDLLALSVTMAENLPAAEDALERVCSLTDGTLPIAVGGAAFDVLGEERLPPGATFTCRDAAEFVRRTRDVLNNA